MANIFELDNYINNEAEDVLQLLPIGDLFSQATLAGKDPNKGFFKAKEGPLCGDSFREKATGEPQAPHLAEPLGPNLSRGGLKDARVQILMKQVNKMSAYLTTCLAQQAKQTLVMGQIVSCPCTPCQVTDNFKKTQLQTLRKAPLLMTHLLAPDHLPLQSSPGFSKSPAIA